MRGRWLAGLAIMSVLGACGSRTPLLRPDDAPLDDSAQAGAAGSTSGDGGDGGGGRGGRGGSGAGGSGASSAGDGSAGDGSAGDGNAGDGRAGDGSAGSGTAGLGEAGFGAGGFGEAGFAGVAGFSGGVGGAPMAGRGGASGVAGDILNPHGCPAPSPFVLSIDPGGSSGTVRGWLESTAGLVFEDQLPRFVREFELGTISDRGIALWWSIGFVGEGGEGSLYFYAGDFTSSTTEIAVAHGVTRLTDVDVDALDFAFTTVDARTGTILVFRNADTGETVAMHMDQIFLTDGTSDTICAAVDASWLFLR